MLHIDKDLLSGPISIVDADWLETEFAAAFRAVLEGPSWDRGGLFRISADHPVEGEFLLSQLRNSTSPNLVQIIELVVHPRDPFIWWEELVGHLEAPGQLIDAPVGTLFIVYESEHIPPTHLANLGTTLDYLARVRSHFIALSVPHSINDAWDLESIGLTVPIPRFLEADDHLRRRLVTSLVYHRVPATSEELRGNLIEHINQHSLGSRLELEQWIGIISESLDGNTWTDISTDCPPPPTSLTKTFAPTRAELYERFEMSRKLLLQTDESFRKWTELGDEPACGLLVSAPSDITPFATSEPMHWFNSLVSWCSSVIGDLGAPGGGFAFLCDYELRSESDGRIAIARRETEPSPFPPFREEIKLLRTAMQHGLPRESSKSLEAQAWYQLNCQSADPHRYDWRFLTSELLSRWLSITQHMADVMSVLLSANAEPAVRISWEKSRWDRVSRTTVREMIEEIVGSIPEYQVLSVGRMLDKCVSKLERELRKSAAKTEFHRDIMRGLISEHVADTYRRLPIHVSDEEWEEIGLEPSGTRAKLLSKAGEEWRSNHCLKDRAELLEWIKAMHLECAD